MKDSNYPAFALLLILAAALAFIVACDGDDDDGGISLSQSQAEETPSGTTPIDAIGTIPFNPPSFAENFAELRAVIEADLESSPLSDETNLDTLVSICDGANSGGDQQFDACIELLELLVAQETAELQPLIQLTAEHVASDFPDRQDEINEAAGFSEGAPTEPAGTVPPGTVPLGTTTNGVSGTVPGN
jgi:hypothetical protein